jgi:hypothetical protein
MCKAREGKGLSRPLSEVERAHTRFGPEWRMEAKIQRRQGRFGVLIIRFSSLLLLRTQLPSPFSDGRQRAEESK